MNRRPSLSRQEYDEFQKSPAFRAFSPDRRFFEPRRQIRPGRILALICLSLLLICLLSNLIVNQFPAVRELDVPVSGLPESFDGIRILHITDLKGQRFGTGQSGLASALRNHPFDLAVLTGDMVSIRGNAEPLYELLEALHDLSPDAPVYLIPGDQDPEPSSLDYAPAGSPFAPWILGAQQRGAVWVNQPQVLTRDGARMILMTLTQGTLDLTALSRRYEQVYLSALSGGDQSAIELAKTNLQAVQELDRIRQSMTEADVLLGLSHSPPRETLRANASGKADSYPYALILSGHTLGGLFRLPLIGPVFYPSQDMPRYGLFPGSALPAGLTRQSRTWVYASAGLGTSDPMYPFWFPRLFNRPEMAVLTLSLSKMPSLLE